jgi:hypothetical protein
MEIAVFQAEETIAAVEIPLQEMEEGSRMDCLATDPVDRQALLVLQDLQDRQLPYDHHLTTPLSFRKKSSGTWYPPGMGTVKLLSPGSQR